VVGEVLWDVFPDSVRLGGAPLNFAVHAKRLGHYPILISSLGDDELGRKAACEIAAFGLDISMLRRSERFGTGTASVTVDDTGQPTFRIARPAAYDDLCLTSNELRMLSQLKPSWFYYGTLFPSTPNGKASLQQLLNALPNASRFYDVNLRSGFDSPELVAELIAAANVVKLNESEAHTLGSILGLPHELESFCRMGAERFGWCAVCITLGERGCAMFDRGRFVLSEGYAVQVADTVGAGDAFAAAFLHGLVNCWPVSDIAQFANRVAALVVGRPGAIPEWSIAEAEML
jgi:fructokinase